MKSLLARAWRAHVFACAFGLMIDAHAAETTYNNELTLEQALALAAERSPLVRTLAAQTESLASRAQAQGLKPAWTLETDFENFAGTGEMSGTDSLESTVQLSRLFERGGKLARRRELSATEVDALAAEQQIRRADLAVEVARRFIDVVSDQHVLAAARRASDLARTARDVVSERVQAGASSPAMLSRAEIALARSQIAQEHAEHELASSRVNLSVLWGDAQPSFGTAAGALFELPVLEPLATYAKRLESSPELARLASDARVGDARIKLAEAGRAADVALAAGVRRLESFDEQALVASFSIPLGTRQRASLEERSVRAERARVESDREAQQLELHARLFGLYQEISHARTEAAALHTSVRPQAEAMLSTTEEGYKAGRFSLLELTDARTQLLEVEREAIAAAAQFHTLLTEIQRITGAPIRALESRSSP